MQDPEGKLCKRKKHYRKSIYPIPTKIGKFSFIFSYDLMLCYPRYNLISEGLKVNIAALGLLAIDAYWYKNYRDILIAVAACP